MSEEDTVFCKNCIHLEPKYDECRCFSPTHIDGGNGLGVWPLVDPAEGWCGQFDDGEELEFIKE
jgi:hypothetical protein